MKSIAITGGIGSGKSTVANILRGMGFIVISADEVSRAQLEQGTEAYQEVVAVFGRDILEPNGRIKRHALGEIIFADTAARQKLEHILHPAIIRQIQQQMAVYATRGIPVIFVEVPLLFEVGMETLFEQVWVVSISPDEQVERVSKRDPLNWQEIRKRIAAQLPMAEKEARADQVLDNNRGLPDLEQQVVTLLHKLELI